MIASRVSDILRKVSSYLTGYSSVISSFAHNEPNEILKYRPSWDDYFLGMALLVARRSHDIHTQHGCVLVKDKRIVATGYNGFPGGMNDASLPTNRPLKDNPEAPHKYDWMEHSEANACANAQQRPEGATAYVTGEPCFNCMKTMWRHGIKKIIHIDSYGSQLIDDRERENKKRFIEETGLVVLPVKPKLDWMLMALEPICKGV